MIFKTTILSAGILAILACQRFESYTIKPPTASRSSPSQGPDPIRPTDDGEGLPGYLVNPKMVSISREAGGLRIVASPGTIIKTSAAAISMIVMEVDGVTNQNFTIVSRDSYALEGIVRSSLRPQDDGSLSELVPYQSDNPVVAFLSQMEADSVVRWESSADQIHAVFYDPTKTEGVRPLTVAILGARYPDAVSSDLPEMQYSTQKSCNESGYFWQQKQSECTSTKLVKLTHCWPVKDQPKLLELIRGMDFTSRDIMVSGFERAVQRGFTLDQCYYVSDSKFYIQLTKLDGEDIELERVDGDVVDFKNSITP